MCQINLKFFSRTTTQFQATDRDDPGQIHQASYYRRLFFYHVQLYFSIRKRDQRDPITRAYFGIQSEGMASVWPTLIRRGSSRGFAAIKVSTFIPYFFAIASGVSPDETV